MRGISADCHVKGLHAMHDFLCNKINLDYFPFTNTRYVEGMPIQTFEALLQNISTRIQLYEFANDGCYNARSISTLSNESFFSDLTHLGRESHDYPKAYNIPHVMGQVVMLNYFKHKPNKSFSLKPTLKVVYPVHVLNEEGN